MNKPNPNREVCDHNVPTNWDCAKCSKPKKRLKLKCNFCEGKKDVQPMSQHWIEELGQHSNTKVCGVCRNKIWDKQEEEEENSMKNVNRIVARFIQTLYK